jgi:hypothetical protein
MWYQAVVLGLLSGLNGYLFVRLLVLKQKAYTDRCKWQAYAALMGIPDPDQSGTTWEAKSLRAGEIWRVYSGPSVVDILVSNATEVKDKKSK